MIISESQQAQLEKREARASKAYAAASGPILVATAPKNVTGSWRGQMAFRVRQFK